MEIRRACHNDIEAIIDYNKKVYPYRSDSIEKVLRFWYLRQGECSNTILLIDDGVIKGEVIASSMSYYIDGNIHDSRWGFDLFVDEELRNDSWGIDLMMYYNQDPSCFSTGSNENALKINLKIGYKLLGSIRKYIKIVNPLWGITSLIRKTPHISDYPEILSVKSTIFKKTNSKDLCNLPCYNPGLLEICRTDEFLDWRLNNLYDYVIYKEDKSDNYFIARVFEKKRVKALAVVDYRCNIYDNEAIQGIVDASILLTKKLKLPFVFFGSSLSKFDEVLESRGYKSVGRPRPIVGKEKGLAKNRKEDIEKREFAFVTLLDSDGETSL